MLRHQILSGALAPGRQLSRLRELIEKLGVARMTVKQAMDALEGEGLAERYSGRGIFVREVELPVRQALNMRADLSELQSVVAQLRVSVVRARPVTLTQQRRQSDFEEGFTQHRFKME